MVSYDVYNHHDRCNTTFCRAAQKKHQCPTSSSDASVSTTVGNSSSQPSTSNVIVNSPSQPSTSNVTINSSSLPSTSNITVNLSSQRSTSPLESETLLDQVARVIAQDCEENRACMRADRMTHHKTSLKYPAVQDSKGWRSSCSLGTSANNQQD